MDFYIDLGFAVLFRILKDRRQLAKLKPAFEKLYHAIGLAYGFESNQPTDRNVVQ